MIVLRYSRLKKNYKKRFDEIIAELNNQEKQKEISYIQEENIKPIIEPKESEFDFYNKITGLNPIFVKNTLDKIDEFENEEKFLNPQISQKLLSEILGTNSTYLSKIINTYKGKSFQLYINDLRLDYIIHHLKTDINFLDTDVKELSNIAGFTNSENFSDNFQRKFKIKPSYFIKMMKEEHTKTFFQSHNPASNEENV